VLTKKLNCFLIFSRSAFFESETLTVLIIKKPSFNKGSSGLNVVRRINKAEKNISLCFDHLLIEASLIIHLTNSLKEIP